MNNWSDSQIYQIAILYYEKGISQKQISELMGISKMSVSRILQKAKDLGIVKINIELPYKLNLELCDEVVKKFKLEKAYIVEINNIKNQKEQIAEQLAKVAAFNISLMDLDNKVIGLGIGRTLGLMVNYLPTINTKNTHIIQLMGGMQDVTFFNPFTIIQEASKKLNAKGTFLTSLAYAENKIIKDNIIQSSPIGKNFKKADIAIFGIGSVGRATKIDLDIIDRNIIEKIEEQGAVGNVLGHFFDKKGNFIVSEIEDVIVSISIQNLFKFKSRIAVAGGEYKREAIRGAILSGIVNILITDEDTAKFLLS